jgi:hypothetical protein
MISRRTGKRAGALMAAMAVAVVASACSSSSPPTSTTTTTTNSGSTIAAITKAVGHYETEQGLASDKYKITSVHLSDIDTDWAMFAIGPVASDRSTLQSGYGFVHRSGGAWRVVGFGSALVGCPLTPPTTPDAVTYVTVPPAVLAGFGLNCPSTSTTTSTTISPTTAAIVAAITAFQHGQNANPSYWTITSVAVSKVDPTWAKFTVGSTPAGQGNFQPFYGFIHRSGSTWAVTGIGTADVGCPPGAPTNQVVPTAVMAGFGITCVPPVSPPSSSSTTSSSSSSTTTSSTTTTSTTTTSTTTTSTTAA